MNLLERKYESLKRTCETWEREDTIQLLCIGILIGLIIFFPNFLVFVAISIVMFALMIGDSSGWCAWIGLFYFMFAVPIAFHELIFFIRTL